MLALDYPPLDLEKLSSIGPFEKEVRFMTLG